jgi:hypothetical protein
MRIRISDATDGAPFDTSSGYFSLSSATIAASPATLDFGRVDLGASRRDTVRISNAGSAPLTISNITTTRSEFFPARRSFTVAAGNSDTLSFVFSPNDPEVFRDTARIFSNASSSPLLIALAGEGRDPILPIQLSRFVGRAVNGEVRLEWSTLSEINNYGFEVQLSTGDSVTFASLANGFVPGHGTTNEPNNYQFIVHSPPPTAYYRLKQIDLDGTTWYSDAIRIDLVTSVGGGITPTEFALHNNYPNPFNPSTTIGFDIPVAGHALLEVFNTLGERVATLVDETKHPGRYTVSFDASRQSSGLYFYRLRAGSFTAVLRMMLTK